MARTSHPANESLSIFTSGTPRSVVLSRSPERRGQGEGARPSAGRARLQC
jgi:hypothetical protein